MFIRYTISLPYKGNENAYLNSLGNSMQCRKNIVWFARYMPQIAGQDNEVNKQVISIRIQSLLPKHLGNAVYFLF